MSYDCECPRLAVSVFLLCTTVNTNAPLHTLNFPQGVWIWSAPAQVLLVFTLLILSLQNYHCHTDEPTILPDSPPQSPPTSKVKEEPGSTHKKKKKKKTTEKLGNASSGMAEDHRKAHKRKIKTEVK